MEILIACGVFLGLGLLLGTLLAFAGKFFSVEKPEHMDAVLALLPGANCGGCGHAGCAAAAEAIAKGESKPNTCPINTNENNTAIAILLGQKPEDTVRYRAQIMCSGTHEITKKKYIYEGLNDCNSAVVLAGGDKLCPNGCIGLGSCARACPFDAIHVVNGIAAVDYEKCRACGVCVTTCPKHIITLIPYDAAYWVGCNSLDKASAARAYCQVGCIGCGLCAKKCPKNAITVVNHLATIDYALCDGCGICEQTCPRKIIWSAKAQKKYGVYLASEDLLPQTGESSSSDD